LALLQLLDNQWNVEDPRCCGKVEHQLANDLVIAVYAVIVCAESWHNIALYDCNKLP